MLVQDWISEWLSRKYRPKSKFNWPKKREGQSEIRAFFLEVRKKPRERPISKTRKNAGQKVDHSDIWEIQAGEPPERVSMNWNPNKRRN